ncbi:hypothetical protein I6H88_13960 [Elizabethkingia bruuniana]|uniref:Uncharacterized protein n=1 Tax=Elizabethkingia bruuniana TaxID=1756149 RepID=A0A7T7UWN3_9FLAO|nr:hypothetical protein [Elizabethkingia bruuniana]AQX84055.1 hypothetical protein AYC65_03030 [Elizabethkingia bruuniana]KGO10254.1 hypothetical protein KS04_11060 [Elizabethkingia miricola]OPB64476.1 hypothetical protein BAY12_06670 [Elizabethkingia bruuniana]QQN57547.1 hypothetical protein I6H88_13960 [Elizabethkingia bruuniana]
MRTRNTIIGILALACIVLIANTFYGWFNPTSKEKEYAELLKYKDKPLSETIPKKKYTDQDGINHIQMTEKSSLNYENTVTQSTKQQIQEKTLKALNAKSEDLQEFTKVKAVISGTLPSADVKIDNKIVTITYQNKYLKIVSRQNQDGKSEADYQYNAEFNYAKVEKKNKIFLWQKPETVLDFSSPDPNFRPTDIEHFKKFVEPQRDRLQLVLENQIQFGIKNPDQNSFSSGVLLRLNPDGFVSPNVGTGLIWQFNNGQMMKYFKVGADINLMRIKK